MKRQPITLCAITVAVTVLATACQDGPAEPFSPNQLPDAVSATQMALRGAPGQEELVRLIPGFAGLYIDEDGVTTVNVVDLDEAGDFDGAIRSFLADQGSEGKTIRTRAVEYTLPELNRWFEAASPVALGLPGAVFVDLDEMANRVTIGVEDAGLIERARQIAGELGIPDEAVRVVVTEPILRMSDLKGRHRPNVGGLQINFSNFVCTLGFNTGAAGDATSQATPQGNGKGGGGGGGKGGGGGDPTAAASFITASHCTRIQGGVENTQYWQPTQGVDPIAIATEVDDPAYKKGKGKNPACARGFVCRQSDAARAAYAGTTTFTLGAIARPNLGPNAASTDWTTGSHFTITGEGAAIVGDVVNKVGRTTGWTQGTVIATNVDTGVTGSNIVLLGQTWVQDLVGGAQLVAGGDSGSSVFAPAAPAGGDNVTLVGLLWGGSGDGTVFVYSPLANIEAELGALSTF